MVPCRRLLRRRAGDGGETGARSMRRPRGEELVYDGGSVQRHPLTREGWIAAGADGNK